VDVTPHFYSKLKRTLPIHWTGRALFLLPRQEERGMLSAQLISAILPDVQSGMKIGSDVGEFVNCVKKAAPI
jgi:hypothetical protein